MARDRSVPDSARLIVASLSGAAERHVNWHEPDEPEAAAAVAEFAEIIGGRGDGPALLAEVADLALGTAEGKGQEYQAKARTIAGLCRQAGADETLIPAWIEEGRRRANAVRPPFRRAPEDPAGTAPAGPDRAPTMSGKQRVTRP
jgi:hypothetical protein